MKTVRQLLDQKKHYRVWSIAPDATVFDAVEMMASKDVGALVVLECHHLVGLIAERDYARKIVLQGKMSKETSVRDVMEKRVATTWPHETVEECMVIMTEARVRHLPVLEYNRLIGIISIGDLVHSIISYQKFAIKQLEHYIQGNGAAL